MVSDQDDDGYQLQCLNRGADSFLSKHDLTVDKMEREIFVTHARRRVADQHSPSIQATASTSIRVPSVAI